MKNTDEKKETTNPENFPMNLAYKLPITPRHDPKSLPNPYKNLEKSALQPKSFTLQRSIQKINVMQARNYLKKPDQKKPLSTSVSSVKTPKKLKEPKIYKSEAFMELYNLENIFEEKNTSKSNKTQALCPIKTKSYKLSKPAVFLNDDYAETTQ